MREARAINPQATIILLRKARRPLSLADIEMLLQAPRGADVILRNPISHSMLKITEEGEIVIAHPSGSGVVADEDLLSLCGRDIYLLGRSHVYMDELILHPGMFPAGDMRLLGALKSGYVLNPMLINTPVMTPAQVPIYVFVPAPELGLSERTGILSTLRGLGLKLPSAGGGYAP